MQILRRSRRHASSGWFLSWFLLSSGAVAENRPVLVDESTGVARAVVVDDAALAHTSQLLPFDAKGEIAKGDIDRQLLQLKANLLTALDQVSSRLTDLVRLNVYVSPEVDAGQLQTMLSKRVLGDVHPAVTYVVTRLPHADALAAIDAIATVPSYERDRVDRSNACRLSKLHGATLTSVLPRGRAVYISGMAERTDDLAAATTGTMKQLHGVLKLLGLDSEHVVHVKAFMKPIAEADVARKAIRAMGSGAEGPSISMVEWSNGLPIEIEMVAYLPGAADPDATVDLRWQPGERRSPVYCRFAVVDSARRIYVSGLRSRQALSAADQVRDVFSQLREVLDTTGSDLQHLVKATYYVANDEASKALNDVRPEFYHPQRPPAASKASIAGTGDPQRTVTVDMIAVGK